MNEATKRKNPKNMRLSDEGDGFLMMLSNHLGLTQTGVMELALRKLARAEGLGSAATSSAGAASVPAIDSTGAAREVPG